MNNRLKRALYESIMKNVSKNVRQTLNEDYDEQLNEGKFKNILKTGALAAGLAFGAPAAHMDGSQALALNTDNTEISTNDTQSISVNSVLIINIPEKYINNNYEIGIYELSDTEYKLNDKEYYFDKLIHCNDYLAIGEINKQYKKFNFNSTQVFNSNKVCAILFLHNIETDVYSMYYCNNMVGVYIDFTRVRFAKSNYYEMTGIDDVETSNDEVQQSQKAVKKIENGKIVIYKGGHKYTAGGALIENKKSLYNSIIKNVAKQVKKAINEELRVPGTGSFVPAGNNDGTDDSFFAALDPIGAGEYWLNSDDAVYIIWYDEDEDEWVVETEGGDYVCSLENDESTQEAIENCDDETLLDWILEDDEY